MVPDSSASLEDNLPFVRHLSKIAYYKALRCIDIVGEAVFGKQCSHLPYLLDHANPVSISQARFQIYKNYLIGLGRSSFFAFCYPSCRLTSHTTAAQAPQGRLADIGQNFSLSTHKKLSPIP